MAEETITLKLIAQDLVSGNITKAIGSIDKMAQRGGIVGSVFQGIGQSIGQTLNPLNLMKRGFDMVTDVIGDSIKAAAEEEASIAQLTQAIEANDASWDGNIAKVEEVISQREDLAFADDEQRDSLRRLVATTDDVTEALDLQATAMDFARLRGIDLGTASDILGKVYSGNTGILSRYGVQLEKGTSATEALAEIQKRAQGQAAAYANTTQGRLMRAQIRMNDAMEDLGAVLTPVIGDLAGLAADVIPAVGDALNNLRRFLDPAGAAIEDLDDMVRDLAGDMDLNGEAIVAWAKAQREAERRTLELEDAIKLMGASTQGTAKFLALVTKEADRYGVPLADLQVALTEVAERQQNVIGVTETQTERWAHLQRILTEAKTTLGLVGDEMDATSQASGSLYDQAVALIESFDSLTDEEKAVALETLGMGEALGSVADEGVAELDQATDSLVRSLKDLPPSMSQAIRDGKEQVREAMLDLRFAMEHPFAEDRYINFLRDKQKAAQALLNEALEDGRVSAANRAAAIVASIQGELAQLENQTYSVNIMVNEFGQRRPGAAPGRAFGGPAEAGQAYWVGEHGRRELFVPKESGTIYPEARVKTQAAVMPFVYAPTFSTASPAEAQRFAQAVTPYLERERRRIA